MFNEYLATLPHEVKIVIAGNHDFLDRFSKTEIRTNIITNAHYLQDSAIKVKLPGDDETVIRIYGSPHTSSNNMGFSLKREKLAEKWKNIPSNTDILITHIPPFNIRDLAWTGKKDNNDQICSSCGEKHPGHSHWGSESLRERSLDLCANGKLKLHLFGHVHDCYGLSEIETISEKTKGIPLGIDSPHNKSKTLLFSNGAADMTSESFKMPTKIELPLSKFKKPEIIQNKKIKL